MHQALYRKWRPGTFSEVSGQDHISSILQYEVKNGKTTHAYLFSGSRGTGKTSCAKILAKAVNCLSPSESGDPCGVCDACRSVDNGTATDVLEMDAASNTGVDYIRDIKEAVIYTPSVLKKRVYIIDEVHMLSTSAFNALLKTLEEPPAHVMFILATTEPQKIPVTILSRCQRFEFRRISVPVIAKRLSYIAEREGIELHPDAASLIAKLAGGGMRDAISLLELCAGGGEAVSVEKVYVVGGVSGRDSIVKMIRAVEAKDYETIFSEIADKYNSAKDLSVFFSDMLSYYRDILVVKRTRSPMDYLEISAAEYEQLKAIADAYPYEKLAYHSKLLEDAYVSMQKGDCSKRLIAEFTLMRMCDPKLDNSYDALLARIEVLEDGRGEPVEYRETKKEETKAENVSVKNATADISSSETLNEKNNGDNKGEGILTETDYWPELTEKLQNYDKPSATFLEMASAYKRETDGKLIVHVQNVFAKNILDRDSVKQTILNIARGYDKSVDGVEIRIKEEHKKNDLIDELYR
ncbi:MAG: DNA polymerase III subunit gamma/tau [Ruminococcaceae bacterium]|nr:DNA polymerase III subunit gamma/tau [Oscillospiraceae bacterium]